MGIDVVEFTSTLEVHESLAAWMYLFDAKAIV